MDKVDKKELKQFKHEIDLNIQLAIAMKSLSHLIKWITAIALLCVCLGSCQTMKLHGLNLLRKVTCPDKPTTVLQADDVARISINIKPWTASEQIKAGQQKGIIFQAKKGERLRIRTADPICFWIYTPTNDVLIDNDISADPTLPVEGTYLLQIAGREDTAFKFSLGLRDLQQAQAVELVKSWLKAKPQIFGPPFDQNLVMQYATGKLLDDITKPDGAISSLKKANSYYTYAQSQVNTVWIFKRHESTPLLKVEVIEDLTLHTPNGIDESNSGRSTSTWTYSFTETDGVWKISNYEKEK